MSQPDVSDYRLAPLLVARIVGSYLVVAAVVMFVATVVVAAAGWPADLLVVVLAAVVAGLLAVAWWLRARAYVVRFEDDGYRVGLVRGSGVRQARWTEVRDAVMAPPGGPEYVVLRLRDERSTTIPVAALAVGREQFLRELRDRLQRGHGLRPL